MSHDRTDSLFLLTYHHCTVVQCTIPEGHGSDPPTRSPSLGQRRLSPGSNQPPFVLCSSVQDGPHERIGRSITVPLARRRNDAHEALDGPDDE